MAGDRMGDHNLRALHDAAILSDDTRSLQRFSTNFTEAQRVSCVTRQ